MDARRKFLRMRRGAYKLTLHHSVRFALDQLVDERRDFGVLTGALQRAEFQPQCGSMRAGLFAQRLENTERQQRLALLELHFGLEHESGHGEACHLGVGTGEQCFGGREFARVDRCPGADHRGQARRLRNRQRLFSVLTSPPITAFQQCDHRRILLRAGALLMLLPPLDAHLLRQSKGVFDDAQKRVAEEKACDQEGEQQIERKLDAIRWRDEQRIAGREPGRHRNGDRCAGE